MKSAPDWIAHPDTPYLLIDEAKLTLAILSNGLSLWAVIYAHI